MENKIIKDIKQIISNFTQNIEINNLETTIRIASYSPSNNEYMTDADNIVINGDILKDIYNSKYNFNNRPKSADAVYKFENGNIYVIEFKNGKINNKEKLDIFKKAYDTFLILLDIGIIKNLNYSRNYATYIVVYNKLKNDEPNKDNIYKYFAKNALSYKEYKFKDLNTLQEILFKESFACTKENFNEYIIPELNKEQN
ncbi:hypothetical protein [Brachyspira hampsonii]|uniref:Restriction endonuclease n=2 Tax=Brachyspira hampsonii TaxID=1287055 RepID=A0AAC9TWG6_9SPIR|nr:hypothetical protein [Brachyspira hampsonii]ASJ22232.1 hypothetical protein BHAMNSH16_11530 [Brachyspira hampsonii]ELV05524.1 hypothetical protein H263_09805 [Brachyspira hampsonii 30599]OEJ19068.1 hypothetical protein A9496_05165 [Brachyspira hampsonii]